MNIVVKENYKLCALIQDKYGAYHAIIYRECPNDYVFCWNYDVTNGSWGQGHYVTTFEAAVAIMGEVLVPDIYFKKGEATKEKIIQATRDYEEAKRLLYKSYAERFEQLPVSECGEVYAEDVLALNEWVENESKRILNEWTHRVVHV